MTASMKVNGKRHRNAPVTFHPATGSRLTLADALGNDEPAPPPLTDLPAIDVHEQLERNAGRYVQVLEALAAQAAKTGDLRLQIRVLTFLARLGAKHPRAPHGTPCASETFDFSGLSTEELRRLIDEGLDAKAK